MSDVNVVTEKKADKNDNENDSDMKAAFRAMYYKYKDSRIAYNKRRYQNDPEHRERVKRWRREAYQRKKDKLKEKETK